MKNNTDPNLYGWEEFKQLQPGATVHKVEHNDVREYKIVGKYPSKSVQSIMITCGTNEGCSKWINEFSFNDRKLYKTRESAVDRLVKDMESDLEAVKRIYQNKK